MKPSMVLLFEVWLLRGVVSPTDRVVGWGVFPVCDVGFRIIEGKYELSQYVYVLVWVTLW